MTKNYNDFEYISRFNISESSSDIQCLIDEYRDRIKKFMKAEDGHTSTYISFASAAHRHVNKDWIDDNEKRFFKENKNETLVKEDYLAECGYIFCMLYAADGSYVLTGHSTGLIQMRHGGTGIVLHTLRNIQFPPKPIYSLRYSKTDERICYAACMDGAIYRVEIPQLIVSVDDPPPNCIRTDPALECLNQQFYGAPGATSNSTPMLNQRTSALSLGLTADGTKIVVGYSDSSIKIWDLETEVALITYKVHKLRLQYIPKKLQRMHFGKVCAMTCHEEKPFMFATAAWDNTMRVWDTRCKVGCMMTFEGLQICSDSLDLNRNICVAGSWQPTEALTTWDLVAKKKINVVRVQNRRPDVDGEYIYACRFWHSTDYNRKGKYAIIGGSGTSCVEVINLHNRYIACSYPAPGTVLAVTSHQDRIAYGGTATTFNIVKFYDPKHEKDMYPKPEEEFDYAQSIFENTGDDMEHGFSAHHTD